MVLPSRDNIIPDLPARFAALIITLAPLFVQRSLQHARVLLVGNITLALGRRTVASVLCITGSAELWWKLDNGVDEAERSIRTSMNRPGSPESS